MKKFVAITLILATFSGTLNSCKKEEEKTPTPTPTPTPTTYSILGTWTWTEAYTPDGSGNYTVPLDPTGIPTGKKITFVGDNTYYSDWNFPQMGIPPATNADNGTYTYSDSLIMTSSVTGKMVRAKVNKLTTNELWFRYNGYQHYELRFTK